VFRTFVRVPSARRLASMMLMPGARRWTLDKPLWALAERDGVAHAMPAH
jgi:hypothetical protein